MNTASQLRSAIATVVGPGKVDQACAALPDALGDIEGMASRLYALDTDAGEVIEAATDRNHRDALIEAADALLAILDAAGVSP